MSDVQLPDEAVAIARDHAAAAGLSLPAWVTIAIGEHASRQPVVGEPLVDDGGFFPYPAA